MAELSKEKREQTEQTMQTAIVRAQQDDMPIVCASTSGETGLLLTDMAGRMGYKGTIIIVRHAGHISEDKQSYAQYMKPEREEKLLAAGAKIVTATHLFDGVNRALSLKQGGAYPGQIIADTLRIFSQGMKVAVECPVMAFDAGLLPYKQPVVSLGGSSRGADTAIVTTPSSGSRFFNVSVSEILCMPQ